MRAKVDHRRFRLRKRLRRTFLAIQPRVFPESLLITRLPRAGRKIALTFDDGPDPVLTPMLLEILGGWHISASLFFIGRAAERHANIVREAVSRGHQVSNHGYDHSVRLSAGWPAYRANILRGEEALKSACPSAAVKHFRPPRGRYPLKLILWAYLNSRTVALWSVDSRDSFGDRESVLRRVHPARLQPGDVLLFHDDKLEAINALDVLIGRLRRAGYAFATLQELVG